MTIPCIDSQLTKALNQPVLVAFLQVREERSDYAVPVLYLILRFLKDLAASRGSDLSVGFGCRAKIHTSTLAMTIEQHRDEILRIAARHGARNVRVFGSVARGEERTAHRKLSNNLPPLTRFISV